MDIRQSDNYARYLENTGWVIENINDVYYFIRKFTPLGSFIKIQRPKKIDLNAINKLVKKYRAFQVLIEPLATTNYQLLTTNYGFRPASPYLPSKTLELDLKKSQIKLLEQMRKNTRYGIKRAVTSLKANPDLALFRTSWKSAVGLKRYVPSSKNLAALKNAFGKNVLFLIDQNTNSGAIFLLSDKKAYYYQAFTDTKGRKNFAQYQIVWQGILWAKKNKARAFDFEGIYDARFPNPKWLGFTHFKAGFGGSVITYPASLKKYYWKNLLIKKSREV